MDWAIIFDACQHLHCSASFDNDLQCLSSCILLVGHQQLLHDFVRTLLLPKCCIVLAVACSLVRESYSIMCGHLLQVNMPC